MRTEIREQLIQMAEEEYKEFSSSLVMGELNMLGVRIPEIRKIAKSIIRNDWRSELEFEDIYFEEKMLRGFIIGYATEKENDIEEAVELLKGFIECIDNWSICDSFCNTFKIVQKHREYMWSFLQEYLHSGKEFEVRTGIIMLLNHFIKCDEEGKKMTRKRSVAIPDLENSGVAGMYEDAILSVLNREFNEGYYAQMAAAWTMAEMFITFPKSTYNILKNSNMDDFTHNKAIQKICESFSPTREVKDVVRKLKRNISG